MTEFYFPGARTGAYDHISGTWRKPGDFQVDSGAGSRQCDIPGHETETPVRGIFVPPIPTKQRGAGAS